ncbi:MAG: hypothetical protein IKN84_00565 [Bacteroidales bacterium]|nr:hypothetical protein [Bacteroidales bacterium]
MEYAATIERPNAVCAAHSARGRKSIDTTQTVAPPESELMEVDEYFEKKKQRLFTIFSAS